jgi:hypothetical protein
MAEILDEIRSLDKYIEAHSKGKRQFIFEESGRELLEVGYSRGKKAKFILYKYNSVGVLKTNQSYNFTYIRLDNGFAKIMKFGKYQEKNEYRKTEFKAYYSDEHIKGYHLIVEEKDGIVTRNEEHPISALELGIDIRDHFSLIPKFRITLQEGKVKVNELIEV